jgi:hypothetical protein
MSISESRMRTSVAYLMSSAAAISQHKVTPVTKQVLEMDLQYNFSKR